VSIKSYLLLGGAQIQENHFWQFPGNKETCEVKERVQKAALGAGILRMRRCGQKYRMP
jgi:hypothetical protein